MKLAWKFGVVGIKSGDGQDFFVIRLIRDELNINYLTGVRDPGYVIVTDDEGQPYGPYESYRVAMSQVMILQWGYQTQHGDEL